MDENDNHYTAYMLRYWREADGSLRATLQNPHSGERRSFANQADLLAFLADQLCNQPTSNPTKGESYHDDTSSHF